LARVQARVVGYVEQTDVHSAGLTVEESLRFSAALRLSSYVALRTRAAFVLEVLLTTELLDIRGNVVGTPGFSGLSVEQRRRLSIGVELVSNPSVVVRLQIHCVKFEPALPYSTYCMRTVQP
jgi:ABC-type multidrug transport system ATPase subunit